MSLRLFDYCEKGMAHIRAFRVATISLSLLAIAGIGFLASRQGQNERLSAYKKTSTLEARAKKRFEESRGLTPCVYDDVRWINAAERKLRQSGQPPSSAMILVAPTFSDIDLFVLSPDHLDRYTFPGTAFGPEFIDDEKIAPQLLRPINLPESTYERLKAAIRRNTEYAMSAREYGHDGVVYYFKYGHDCATMWSPSQETIGGHLGELVDALSGNHPSPATAERNLKSLEDLELIH